MREVEILPSTAFVDNSSLPNNLALFNKNGCMFTLLENKDIKRILL